MNWNLKSGVSTGAAVAAAMACLQLACGGGSSSPSAPSGGGSTVTTITISATGVSDASPRVALGARVRFTNNDSRPHEILTTPHLIHTDCPALNEVGMLQPGQSKDSGALNERTGCGFHDHLNPDDQRFRGQIIVGFSEGEPAPPPEDY